MAIKDHCPFTGAITDQFLRILQETLCASTIISYYIYGHISVQGLIMVSMDVTWSLVKIFFKNLWKNNTSFSKKKNMIYTEGFIAYSSFD